MPIYDYTYQTWKGERQGPLYRWLAIPKFTYLEYLGNRSFLALFWIAWVPFLMFLCYLYLEVNTELLALLPGNMKSQGLPPITPYFFKRLIDIQSFFCVAFAFMLGASLISRDLVHNALVLYISKPISRWEYFVGKFSVVFSMSMLLTWIQVAVLFGLQLAISDPASRKAFGQPYAQVFIALTLYCLVIATTLSLLILAASSLVKNGKLAGLIFVIYIIGASIMGAIVSKLTEMPNLEAISPWTAIWDLGYAMFKLKDSMTITSLTAAWTGILGNWALCGLIIHWRMANAAKNGR